MKTKGFTLIEMLIVIAVISILIGIALPRFKGMQEEGNIAKAKGELRTLQTAVESYYIHNGSVYPASLVNVTTQRPQIVSSVPNDPFGASNYVYSTGGTNLYVIYSVGPAGNGSATISTNGTLTEVNGDSCIYVSNLQPDTKP